MWRKRNKRKNTYAEDVFLTDSAPFIYREAYKELRSNLSFVTKNGEINKIMVTSAYPEESKTSVSINLAIALAEIGKRVILLDCDMRNYSMREYLNILEKERPGMSAILAKTAEPEEGIIALKDKGVDLILSGKIPPNPAELMTGKRVGDVLDALSEKYDYIICDTPPVNVVSDALNLVPFIDGVLLTVRQQFTNTGELLRMKEKLVGVDANILGTVMVRYQSKQDMSSYGTYRKYGYNKYYGKYGKEK